MLRPATVSSSGLHTGARHDRVRSDHPGLWRHTFGRSITSTSTNAPCEGGSATPPKPIGAGHCGNAPSPHLKHGCRGRNNAAVSQKTGQVGFDASLQVRSEYAIIEEQFCDPTEKSATQVDVANIPEVEYHLRSRNCGSVIGGPHAQSFEIHM
jgi:hypothetical protein